MQQCLNQLSRGVYNIKMFSQTPTPYKPVLPKPPPHTHYVVAIFGRTAPHQMTFHYSVVVRHRHWNPWTFTMSGWGLHRLDQSYPVIAAIDLELTYSTALHDTVLHVLAFR